MIQITSSEKNDLIGWYKESTDHFLCTGCFQKAENINKGEYVPKKGGDLKENIYTCNECGKEINSKTESTFNNGGKKMAKEAKKQNKALISGLVIIILIIFVFILTLDTGEKKETEPKTTPTPTRQTSPTVQEDLLELVSFRCYTEYDYFHIVGEVKNISGKSLENVMAVGIAYTDEGEFVKSGESLIDYNPILFGQTSPFEVLFTDNPAIKKCNLNFKEFWGGTIPFKDSTKKND